MRRTPYSEEVLQLSSSAFRYQNRQQDLAVRPCRRHRSEARLSQCIGHSPNRSRGTRHLPFVVCIAHQLSPLSSWPPSLGTVLLAAPLDGLTPILGTMRPLTAATPHLSGSSPRLPRHIFPTFRPQTLDAASTSLPTTTVACRVFPDFALNPQARRVHPAESGSLSYGPPVRLQLLSTPPRGDAVTFDYRAVVHPDTDFHRANVAPSRAHGFRFSPE